MTLSRVSAAAVKAGEALDRADTLDELERIWRSEGCDNYRAAERRYLLSIYQAVTRRIARAAHNLKLARAY